MRLPIILICLFCFVGLLSCEKNNFLPIESDSGEHTFGYLTGDSIEIGGNIDDDDLITDYYDGRFQFLLNNKRSAHMWQSIKWNMLELNLRSVPMNGGYGFVLDSARYAVEYTNRMDEKPHSIDSVDHYYELNSFANNMFNVDHYNLAEHFLSGNFDLTFSLSKVYNDSSYLDTSNSQRLFAGRFDINY